MRLPLIFSLTAAAALLGTPHLALADDSMTCMGNNAPTLQFSLAAGPNQDTIAVSAIENVLNIAECECDSQDLYLVAKVVKPLSVTPLPAFSLWAGTSCNATTRATSCEQITSNVIDVTNFKTGAATGTPKQQVPVKALVSPLISGSMGTTGHECIDSSASNSLWFLFGDTSNPDYCYVRLNYAGLPPDVTPSLTASSGDSAITLTWTAPSTGGPNPPQRYQVLCAKADGSPLDGQGAYSFGQSATGHKLGYSTCIDPGSHNIQRQVLSTGGVTDNGDGGVVTTVQDLALFAPPVETQSAGNPFDPSAGGLGTRADPLDGGTSDGGVKVACPNGLPDGGALAIFPHLDKKYVCSDVFDSSTVKTYITGLTNDQVYYFAVVSIDAQGNPNASQPVCGQPKAVDDLYRRFLEAGGKPQGFCFIATAAFGSYQDPFVMVLRDFRDQALLPTHAGANFVAWYYRTSPPLAKWIEPRGWARFVVRMALWPVIVAAALWLEMSTGAWLLVGALAFAFVAVRLARRSRARGATGGSVASVAPKVVGSEA